MSVVFTLVVVEIVVRVVLPPPRYHRAPLWLDSDLGFRGIPEHVYSWIPPIEGVSPHEVTLNREGFRGRDLPHAPAPDDIRRIVFLGDSFVVGEAVPEEALMTSRVEARWPEGRERVEVYGLATIDYGTGQELLLLDRFGAALQPDLVVLAIFPTNDVANNARGLAGRTRVSPGDPIRPYVRPRRDGVREIAWAMPLRAGARRVSRLFGWVERGLFPPQLGAAVRASPLERMSRGRAPREFLEVFARHHDPGHRWEVAWRETEALIRAVRERCADIGSELLVLVIPSIDQVVLTPKRIRHEIEAHVASRSLGDFVDWNAPENRLYGFLEAEGIEARFLLGDFRRATREGLEIYSRDRHLTAEGHAMAARAVLDGLTTGAAHIRDSARERSGEPVFAKPVLWNERSDPSWLDLRRHPHSRNFGDGWIGWQAERVGQEGGWRLGAGDALVALRAGEGAVVIRGRSDGSVGLETRIVGSRALRFEIPESGPFEVVLPVSPSAPESPSGHIALAMRTIRQDDRVLLQELGFEGAHPAGDPTRANTQTRVIEPSSTSDRAE